MSGGLDKVYHFVHIGFDPGEHPLFEEGLKEVLEKIANETIEGVKSAIVFVDDTFSDSEIFFSSCLPENYGRRKRIQELVKILNPDIPVIQGLMEDGAFYKIKCELKKCELSSLIIRDRILRLGKELKLQGVTSKTEHFICGEYLWRCVDTYAELVNLVLGYKCDMLGQRAFGYSDVFDGTLARNPCLVKAGDN